jgi:hypothetical protein
VAITVTNRHATGSGTDATSYNFSLTGLGTLGRWLCFDIYSQVASGTPNTPSLSGGSLTYVQEAQNAVHQFRRLTRFYAWNPSSASYTLTVDFAGETQVRCACHVNEIDGADLTDPFAQTVVSTSSASATSGDVTLAAYANADNRFLAALFQASGLATTEEHTQLAETSTETIQVSTQWHATTQDTTPSWTWTNSAAWAVIASEIRVPEVAGAATDPFGMSGFFGA